MIAEDHRWLVRLNPQQEARNRAEGLHASTVRTRLRDAQTNLQNPKHGQCPRMLDRFLISATTNNRVSLNVGPGAEYPQYAPTSSTPEADTSGSSVDLTDRVAPSAKGAPQVLRVSAALRTAKYGELPYWCARPENPSCMLSRQAQTSSAMRGL